MSTVKHESHKLKLTTGLYEMNCMAAVCVCVYKCKFSSFVLESISELKKKYSYREMQLLKVFIDVLFFCYF